MKDEYIAIGYVILAIGLWFAVRDNARRRGTTRPPITWLPGMPFIVGTAFVIVLWMRACR